MAPIRKLDLMGVIADLGSTLSMIACASCGEGGLSPLWLLPKGEPLPWGLELDSLLCPCAQTALGSPPALPPPILGSPWALDPLVLAAGIKQSLKVWSKIHNCATRHKMNMLYDAGVRAPSSGSAGVLR